MSNEAYDVYEVIFRGGVVMWFILAVSIVALAITIERFFTLRRATIDTREFMDSMRTILRQNRVQEAIAVCDETDAPVSRILKAGLLKHDRRKEDIREAMEDAGNLEIPRLERYMSALATCAQIAPLLGLLGTVAGMIKAFAQIHNKQGQVNPSDLAEGISNALVTTVGGLTVAIPALVMFNYFQTRVNNLILEMEISSSELIELLTKERDSYEI